MAFHPDAVLVTTTWLQGLAGLPVNQIGPLLPQDNSTWAASGFVQATVVGGNPEMHLPVAEPVVQIDCWATNPQSGKPPWHRAAQLAEIIRAATYDDASVQRLLTLPAAYDNAHVLAVWLLTEPRRAPAAQPSGRTPVGDEASYARITMDAQFRWRTVPA